MIAIVKANINNLIGVWRIASTPFNACVETPDFSWCSVPGLEWPNKLWFNGDITEEVMRTALDSIPSGKMVIPYWNATGEEIIIAQGGIKGSEQAGMSLKLERPFRNENRLLFRAVNTLADAALWAGIYPQAFGYSIDQKILEATYSNLRYYLALLDGQPVGTAILHLEDGIAGIHGVGVIPEARRKGFANEIMAFVLNESLALNARYATLQASQMGKGIYLDMGFEEQFVIRNYAVHK
ncbi:GNAT family N-acetyltransferase [Chitinophaga sp. ARDCPP14]|uniref:GNAT family N-acetyltransferase n=1 Tax=Chitinophaga sp. ARDCPP14 TaxID=3391139 RepID=UPI003F528416